MTRKKNEFPPPPKLHAYEGDRKRWATHWTDGQGRPRFKSFGYSDDTTPKQALRRYQNWLDTDWKAKPTVRDPGGEQATYTATRLAADYLRHARRVFVKHGKRTSHVWNVRMAMRAIRTAWGEQSASDVEAPALAALRDRMVFRTDKQGRQVPRAIKTVNGRLTIIVQAFDHARERGKVSREVVADLKSVKRLRKGRTEAKASKRIKSAPKDAVVEARKILPAPVLAIIDLLEITGMRPNEPCIMRGCDLVTNSEGAAGLWEYRPSRHKLEHLGDDDESEKIVFLGERAQNIIRPFLVTDTTAYLFSPAAAQAQRLEDRHKARKTKLYPSHAAKRRENPTAGLGQHYTSESLRRAVHYACKRAGVRKWNPGQLRHTAATAIEKRFGRDGSRVVLGHTSERTTLIYLDPDVQKAMQIAREVG
jgi:integrase